MRALIQEWCHHHTKGANAQMELGNDFSRVLLRSYCQRQSNLNWRKSANFFDSFLPRTKITPKHFAALKWWCADTWHLYKNTETSYCPYFFAFDKINVFYKIYFANLLSTELLNIQCFDRCDDARNLLTEVAYVFSVGFFRVWKLDYIMFLVTWNQIWMDLPLHLF